MTSPGLRERVFLLEIGTEEIPARMLRGALEDLASGLHDAIVSHDLAPAVDFSREESFEVFGTPRRLAVQVGGILDKQPDRQQEVTGPPVRAAFDAAGEPTRAAEGFARAQGVAPSDLLRLRTAKGECVGVRRRVVGRPAAEVLAGIVPAVVAAMSFPKTMRWGLGLHRFVRPVHNVVALLDNQVVEMTIAGVASGRETFGRRSAGEPRVPLKRAGDYVDALRRNGVLADMRERRQVISDQLRRAAEAAGGRIAPPPGPGSEEEDGDPELLDEVNQMVEWPLVIEGEFDPDFLDLPTEILVTAMRHHQKCFSLLAGDGRLLNRFLSVANCTADRTGAIRRGNTWVLQARLADARFFWQEDRKRSLAARLPDLQRVTFHERLGSYAAKGERIVRLAELIRAAYSRAGSEIDADAVREAARLCKVDLTTQMVNEFPELQGIVGALYARSDGAPPGVCAALYDHYLPAGTDDPIPSTPVGAIVSLADRLDTQAGIFMLGMVPTGSRDPYGLRRSVQGVCRIIVDAQVPQSLTQFIDWALEGFRGSPVPEAAPQAQVRDTLLEFYRGRLQYLAEEASLRQDTVRAALAAGFDDPYDARLRMLALDAIRQEPDFESLATAHKRIKKILQGQVPHALMPELLTEEAELSLNRAAEDSSATVDAKAADRDYLAALRAIARLRPHLDRFFDEVMVMAEDRNLRQNRLALLQDIAGLFMKVGDFSEIVVAGEPAVAATHRTSPRD